MLVIGNGSRGPLVSFLQLTLKDLNLYSGVIDGIFGIKTINAVKEFQTRNNLIADGIVGIKTWDTLLPYIQVPTTIPYTYDILMLNIQALLIKYTFISSGSIGDSVMDKDIPFIKLGNGSKQLLYVARHTCQRMDLLPSTYEIYRGICDSLC